VTSDPDFKVTTVFDIEYQKRHEVEPQLLQNINRKSYALYRMVTFPMTLTDPNPVFKVTSFFEVEYLKNGILGTKFL